MTELEKAFELAKQRGEVPANAQLNQFTVEMQVHRAKTGKTEDYGIISAYHKNPIKHYWMQFGIWHRGIKRKYGRSINK